MQQSLNSLPQHWVRSRLRNTLIIKFILTKGQTLKISLALHFIFIIAAGFCILLHWTQRAKNITLNKKIVFFSLPVYYYYCSSSNGKLHNQFRWLQDINIHVVLICTPSLSNLITLKPFSYAINISSLSIKSFILNNFVTSQKWDI